MSKSKNKGQKIIVINQIGMISLMNIQNDELIQ